MDFCERVFGRYKLFRMLTLILTENTFQTQQRMLELPLKHYLQTSSVK